MAEMRRGIGEDKGRSRLTFRYRDRVFRLAVTTTGEVVREDKSGSEGLIGVAG